eukprot:TRINITY_DN2996_c0_g1_i2.p1 TRINITY_DN2996_c0_g1~~TRINITY_DN2996_c0_g1_i2.p1  ORF type:complete len:166 (-),score=50.46 TRINITY_DN2996_c0_g1_i2:126-623(-)
MSTFNNNLLPIHQNLSFDPQQYVPICEDFTEFQSYLSSSRRISNDNLTFTLNRSDGSLGSCQEVWSTMEKINSFRSLNIKRCLSFYEEKLEAASIPKKEDNIYNDKKVKNGELRRNDRGRSKNAFERKAISFLNSELEVEKILREQAAKTIRTRCQGYPSQSSLS